MFAQLNGDYSVGSVSAMHSHSDSQVLCYYHRGEGSIQAVPQQFGFFSDGWEGNRKF